MLERDHSWNEPATEFFNNYPGGWAQEQYAIACSHYGNNSYSYNWKTGTYSNKLGGKVSFDEVYNNYVVPNSDHVKDPEKFLRDYNKTYASALYGISDYNAMLSAGLGASTKDDKHSQSNGNVISFSFDFAFAGGIGFEIGRVSDNFGNKKWFFSIS